MPLCAVCTAMFEQREKRGKHHESFQDMKKAIEDGCQVCYACCEEFRSTFPVAFAKYSGDFQFQLEAIRQIGKGNFLLCITSRDSDQESWLWSSLLVLRKDQKCLDQVDGSRLHVLSRTRSKPDNEANATEINQDSSNHLGHDTKGFKDMALGWLNSCRSKHFCGTSSDSNWHPKRLLCLKERTVKLVVCDQDRPSGPYVALSHCWGINPNFLTLTSSNLEQFRNGISASALPANFRDLVHITAELGFQYLWIDSLCILQAGEGSKQDWLLHATEMASVYSNSALNISSHHAENATHPCFASRDPRLVQECLVYWHGFTQTRSTYSLFSWYVHGHGALKLTRLSSRGWVIQERLLSPRILHFTKLQIFWECECLGLISESSPHQSLLTGPISKYHGPRPFTITSGQEKKKIISDGKKGPAPLDEMWPCLVNEYTRCKLTNFDDDILIALAGVARQYATACREKYWAGLWSSDLLWQIVWRVGGEPMPFRSAPEIHPSWSWASIKGPVHMLRWDQTVNYELLASVHNVEIALLDANNPFGAVKAGSHLTLHAFMFPVSGPGSFSRFDSMQAHFSYQQTKASVTVWVSWDYCDGSERDNDHIFVVPVFERNGSVQVLVVQRRPNGNGFERIGSGYTGINSFDATQTSGLMKLLSLEGVAEGKRQLIQIF